MGFCRDGRSRNLPGDRDGLSLGAGGAAHALIEVGGLAGLSIDQDLDERSPGTTRRVRGCRRHHLLPRRDVPTEHSP